MQIRRFLIPFAACLPLLCAAQTDFVNEQMRHGSPPAHPTLLLTPYEKSEEMIVSAHGDQPQIELNKKLQTVYGTSNYQPVRGALFAPGSVQVLDEHADSRYTQMTYYMGSQGTVSGGDWDHHSDYQATLVASRAYKDCYIAVMFFDGAFMKGTEAVPKISLAFQEVGDLEAGKPTKVKMRFGYIDPKNTPNLTFFPLVFTHGTEIESNHSHFSAAFFRRLELARHERILADYKAKNAGKDAPLRPYVRVMPKFPEHADLDKYPAVVKTSCMVDTDGTVYSVEFEDNAAKEVEKPIRAALRGWLFMPRLKAGVPERTLVRIPIQLHPGTEPAVAEKKS